MGDCSALGAVTGSPHGVPSLWSCPSAPVCGTRIISGESGNGRARGTAHLIKATAGSGLPGEGPAPQLGTRVPCVSALSPEVVTAVLFPLLSDLPARGGPQAQLRQWAAGQVTGTACPLDLGDVAASAWGPLCLLSQGRKGSGQVLVRSLSEPLSHCPRDPGASPSKPILHLRGPCRSLS